MTSFFGGCVIFSVLGFMSYSTGLDIKDVAESGNGDPVYLTGKDIRGDQICHCNSGPGLVFNVYPKAVSLMPGAPIWALLFFFMIIMVAIDSQFVCVEGFVTAIYDQFEHHLKIKYAREILTAIICLFHFVLGLAMVTEGGIYVFLIFDYYAASGMVLLLFCLCEVIAISWVYGVNKWSRDVEDMVGHKVNIWLKICWSIITPAASLVSFDLSEKL